MKQFVALARVSSREQEREGFSLAIQEDALRRYAEQAGGTIIQFFRIAETASKAEERKAFRQLLAFAKKHCAELDGLLFYKVDRAARNLYDYVELERLESDYQVPFISVSQPTEHTPAGRMMRRTLANMASFYTEQQSVDVREGLARRVQEGWFVGHTPYGYRNVRRDGRSVVVIDESRAKVVRRIFQLFAYEPLTLDALLDRLHDEVWVFRDSSPRFPRSSVHAILKDRSYVGEVRFRGEWYPGKHEPLVDRMTWDRVQALLGGATYRTHEMTYAGEFMTCGHCGHPVTGERKIKKTKSGEREYVYYRCARYNRGDHPRTRVTEGKIDRQMLALFDRMRIKNDDVREWFRAVLASQTRDAQVDALSQREELTRQESLIVVRQDRLLNMRINEEVDEAMFARKHTEMRDQLAKIKLQLDVLDRSRDESAELAVKAFELSQTLRDKWLTADYSTKRRILEIVCLNCRLNGATLEPEIRKPFDVLAEGLISEKSRGDRI
jgi:DNA invertase Pin-like site-specific DNA recombinase